MIVIEIISYRMFISPEVSLLLQKPTYHRLSAVHLARSSWYDQGHGREWVRVPFLYL